METGTECVFHLFIAVKITLNIALETKQLPYMEGHMAFSYVIFSRKCIFPLDPQSRANMPSLGKVTYSRYLK